MVIPPIRRRITARAALMRRVTDGASRGVQSASRGTGGLPRVLRWISIVALISTSIVCFGIQGAAAQPPTPVLCHPVAQGDYVHWSNRLLNFASRAAGWVGCGWGHRRGARPHSER